MSNLKIISSVIRISKASKVIYKARINVYAHKSTAVFERSGFIDFRQAEKWIQSITPLITE